MLLWAYADETVAILLLNKSLHVKDSWCNDVFGEGANMNPVKCIQNMVLSSRKLWLSFLPKKYKISIAGGGGSLIVIKNFKYHLPLEDLI